MKNIHFFEHMAIFDRFVFFLCMFLVGTGMGLVEMYLFDNTNKAQNVRSFVAFRKSK